MLYERVDDPAHLPGISCNLRDSLFIVIELFKNSHRQVDILISETEEALRVVHEDVGIEHEKFPHFSLPGRGTFLRM